MSGSDHYHPEPDWQKPPTTAAGPMHTLSRKRGHSGEVDSAANDYLRHLLAQGDIGADGQRPAARGPDGLHHGRRRLGVLMIIDGDRGGPG